MLDFTANVRNKFTLWLELVLVTIKKFTFTSNEQKVKRCSQNLDICINGHAATSTILIIAFLRSAHLERVARITANFNYASLVTVYSQ